MEERKTKELTTEEVNVYIKDCGQTWQEQAGDFKAATFFRRKRGSGNGIGTSYHVV